MKEEIPEDYYLKYPEEKGPSGPVYDRLIATIAALKEMIPIAERVLKHYPESAPVVEHFKSAIENAKSLITPQKEQTPQ